MFKLRINSRIFGRVLRVCLLLHELFLLILAIKSAHLLTQNLIHPTKLQYINVNFIPTHARSTNQFLYAECRESPTKQTPLDCLTALDNCAHPLERHEHKITAANNVKNAALRARSLIQAPTELPDFVEPIGNHTVAIGRDAQLSCKIKNLATYRTAWLRVEDKGILTIHNNVITRNYRFGLQINEDEQNFILTIRNVQPSDKGGYMCQINSIPMKYEIGFLDVLTPPSFDDSALDPSHTSTQASVQDGSDSDLSLANAASSKAANSSSLTTVVQGASATLSCTAHGHPKPSITWRREDNQSILLNGLVKTSSGFRASDAENGEGDLEIKNATSLSFKSVNRANSGAYLCIASNGVQPSASKRLLLDVQFSPVITVTQSEVAGFVKQREARLECQVELNPAGTYHWIKLTTSTTNTDRWPVTANQEDDLWLIDHDELTQSDKFDIVIKQINSEKAQMILTIRQVEKQDFSWFKCIAKNALGLQSNFVRFYESSPAQNGASTTSSSSFSFNNIIRGQQQRQQQDDTKLNLPQNDDSRQSTRLSSQRSGSITASSSTSRSGSPPGNSLKAASLFRLPISHLALYIYSCCLSDCQFMTQATLLLATTLLLAQRSAQTLAVIGSTQA